MYFDATVLNLPPCRLNLKERVGRVFVFDVIRKKDVLLTPEEWVRQHFIHYLMSELQVPKAFISVENGLELNGQVRRSDVLIHDRDGNDLLMVECKASSVSLNQSVMDQVVAYNMVRHCKWLVLTNGLQHIYACVTPQGLRYFKELPMYHLW